MQILPPGELLPFIKHYLFLEGQGNDYRKLRLFSDGNTGIVFSNKNSLMAGFKNYELPLFLPNSFLYGQITGFRDIYLLNKTDLIIVVFQPTGIHQLLGIPAPVLRDNIINIDYVFGKKSPELQEKLGENFTVPDKIRQLNVFFIGLLAKRKLPGNMVINASLNYIVKNKGLISSDQLVKFTGYTERHIERTFVESIGINPKKFGNIIKLHHFLRQLKNGLGKQNLAATAYEAGYSDQSHLIREFKKITGMTPTFYINKADKLTINFVEFAPGMKPLK